MALDSNQIDSVKKWVSEGAGISQVQKLLASEFGINMTYMDVRFVLDDIDAELKDSAPAAADLSLDARSNAADKTSEAANGESVSDASDAAGVPGEVTVTKNSVQRPGAIMGGDVIFSDGGKAEWVLDQSGQLGLIPSVQGYNPPQEDLPVFQNKLRELLGMEAQNESDASAEPEANPNEDSVQVSISPIQRPDSLAFGDATFSDGSKAEWRIDREGALALIPADKDKKPPQADMPVFQRKLHALLQKMY